MLQIGCQRKEKFSLKFKSGIAAFLGKLQDEKTGEKLHYLCTPHLPPFWCRTETALIIKPMNPYLSTFVCLVSSYCILSQIMNSLKQSLHLNRSLPASLSSAEPVSQELLLGLFRHSQSLLNFLTFGSR